MKLEDADSRAIKARRTWLFNPLIWLIAVAGFLCRVLLMRRETYSTILVLLMRNFQNLSALFQKLN